MKAEEILNLMGDKAFLDSIYQFSYHRCNTSHDAEDLCQDIILAAISSLVKIEAPDNFYAYVWSVARKVYANFCAKRHKLAQTVSLEDDALPLAQKENEIEQFLEQNDSSEQFHNILICISFLAKIYRDVMVMYYLDEIPIKDIARRLHINEATVKQRLFYARNTVRKEAKNMNQKNLSLKPVRFIFFGTGNPCGNDPRTKAERAFSQNLVYLCKGTPKTAKELSEELCMPMPYIEEELEIQCHGENGDYGLLRKLDNGKYITNIFLVDYKEYDEANKIYQRYVPEYCALLKANLEQQKEKFLSFPFLSPQKDLRFILWGMVINTISHLEWSINTQIARKYFSDITPLKREFTSCAIAYNEKIVPNMDFYGRDGASASKISGYKSIFLSNVYGERMDKHFACGHNISLDKKLLLTIKAIGGLPLNKLTEEEKEIAAKAIECGYLRRSGDSLEPKIIVMDRAQEELFRSLSSELNNGAEEIIEKIAGDLAAFMKKHIPAHLMNEYQIYTQLIAGVRILSDIIEECIKEGFLTAPESRLCAEGILMIVEK